MKFLSTLFAGLLSVAAVHADNSTLPNQGSFTYERLSKNDSLLLIVDHQEGLFQLVNDFESTYFRKSVVAHAALGQAFDIPVILTTSAETGPNGPMMHEIVKMYPDAPYIKRQGEINAWDNEEFRDLVNSYGKSQIIVGGIVTEACTAFLALSLREAGYSVYANIEASGTSSELIRDVANQRMASAGVNLLNMFAIVCELVGDWRIAPGSKELFPWLDVHWPAFSSMARGHKFAVTDGEILDGEDVLE